MIRKIIWIVRSLKRLSILFVRPLSITASQRVFILEGGVAGFPQFGKKKLPHKIYVAGSNWAQKKKTQVLSILFFWNKVFEKITDNNTDLKSALLTYFELL